MNEKSRIAPPGRPRDNSLGSLGNLSLLKTLAALHGEAKGLGLEI